MAATGSRGFKYHVFLSFRGSDTRLQFTGHLWNALNKKGINTFIDFDKLPRGDEITLSLLKGIQDSRVAIIVLSNGYASSSFCLDELATIVDCKKKGMLVIPVFYKVDPSDVRHLRGSFEEAMAEHESRFQHDPEKLQKWKTALRHVADLSGHHLIDGVEYEYTSIERIVGQVSRAINHVPLRVADYPVGLETQVVEIKKLLLLDDDDDDDVRMIGIHGMGGVGKSTLARAVYNDLIAENFDGFCFLENVKEKSNIHGLEHLQSSLLLEILGKEDINLPSWQKGAQIIKDRLHGMKVLLVLDDVDTHKQLNAIAGRSYWFGRGSRVIITTRDTQLLAPYVNKRTYEVKGLNEIDALQLLKRSAFKKEKVDPSYEEVLNRVVIYASGLPLALEVIGSNLFGKSIQEWQDAINKYERSVPKGIQGILKISFDALEEEEKSIFLDIACCFNGYKLAEVEDILCAHYGSNMKGHINVLIEKSLMKLSYGRVTLHDLIEHMGKDIVRQESPTEPEERSRLCSWEDIKQVLEDNTGTSKIKTIHLEFPIFSKEMVEWDEEAFKKMPNLRTLIIKNGNFSKGPEYFPNGLRILEWRGYPSHCLPSDFHPKKLFICKLPNSHIKSLKFNGLSKTFKNLAVLSLNECEFLSETPDVSGLPNLEEFSFAFCKNLVTVHKSIGFHDKLKKLNAFGCPKLGNIPPIRMTCLEKLNLSYCGSLESFPEISGKMENIKEEGEEKLGPIKFLDLEGSNLNDDFVSIGFIRFAHVESLNLSRNNFTHLPQCMEEFQYLKVLDVSECKLLREISAVPPKLNFLYATNCESLNYSSRSMFINQELHAARILNCYLPGACVPEWFVQRSSGPSSLFWFRNHFPAKILCLAIAPVICYNDIFYFPIPMVYINGEVQKCRFRNYKESERMTEMDHTCLFHLLSSIYLCEVPFAKEWSRVEVTYEGVIDTSLVKLTGIHIFSSLEDIRFHDPCN